jgi:hypothetical protein
LAPSCSSARSNRTTCRPCCPLRRSSSASITSMTRWHCICERFSLNPKMPRSSRRDGGECGTASRGGKGFSTALTLRPNHASAHMGLAKVYRLKGRYQDAVAQLADVLRANPREPSALLERGLRSTEAETQRGLGRISRSSCKPRRIVRRVRCLSESWT